MCAFEYASTKSVIIEFNYVFVILSHSAIKDYGVFRTASPSSIGQRAETTELAPVEHQSRHEAEGFVAVVLTVTPLSSASSGIVNWAQRCSTKTIRAI